MELQVQVREGAVTPEYAHVTDAGMDLFTTNEEGVVIAPGGKALISTGVKVAIPEGYVGIIKDKSGLAAKSGLTVLGGVIDSGYRGEIAVILLNTSIDIASIGTEQKIAQLLIVPVVNPNIVVVDVLPETKSERGEGGFGSTGLRSRTDVV